MLNSKRGSVESKSRDDTGSSCDTNGGSRERKANNRNINILKEPIPSSKVF